MMGRRATSFSIFNFTTKNEKFNVKTIPKIKLLSMRNFGGYKHQTKQFISPTDKNDFILYNILQKHFETLIKTRRHQNIHEIICETSKDLLLPDNIVKKTMYSMIEAGKLSLFEDIKKSYEEDRRMSESHYIGLISSCIPRGDYKTAFKFLEEMNSLQFKVDIEVYTKLLKVIVNHSIRKDEKTILVDNLIDEIKEKNLSLNYFFYSELSNYFAHFNELLKLKSILKYLLDNQIRMENNDIYHNIILVYFNQEGMEGIKKAFKELLPFGFTLDHSTYDLLLQSNAEKGYVENVNNILNSMKAANFIPNENTYFLLAKSYAKIPLFPQISDMFEKLKEISPNNQNYPLKFISIYRNAAAVQQLKQFSSAIEENILKKEQI